VINLNAATLLNNVIGLPVPPQITGSKESSGNSFQALIQSLLNNADNSENSNNSNLAAQVQADPKVQSAVFQAVSTLFILGKISSAANSTADQLSNNPVVNKIIQDNNLTPEQAQLASSAIKTAVAQLAYSITQPVSADNNINDIINARYQTAAAAGNNTDVPDPASGAAPLTVTAPVNAAANGNAAAAPKGNAIITPASSMLINNAVQPVQPLENAVNNLNTELINNAVQPAQFTANAANSNPVSANTDIKTIQLVSPQTLIAPIPAAGTSGVQPLTPAAVNPAVNTGSPALVNDQSGKTADSSFQTVQTAADVSSQANDLISELKDIIADLMALLTRSTQKDSNAGDSLKQITEKINELSDKINQLSLKQQADSRTIKDITNSAADILAAISAALNNAVVSAANNSSITNSNDKETQAVITQTNGGSANYNGTSRWLQASVNTGNKAQDLITKIYSLLKEMNGSVQVLQKTVYIYKQNIIEGQYAAKDGATAVNLASPAAGTNDAEQGISQAAVPAIGLNADNNSTGTGLNAIISVAGTQQVVLDLTPEQTAINAGATEASVNSGAINTAANNQPGSNSSGRSENTMASAIVTAGTSVNPVKITPVFENTEKQAVTASGTDKNIQKDIDWMARQINTAVSAVVNNDGVSNPKTLKLFDDVVDFAKDTRNNLVIKQVITSLRDTIQVSKQTEIKITLKPENLGVVTVKLESRDGMINGKIQAMNADVRDILKANLPDLKIALNNMGLNVNKFEVSTMQNNNIGNGLNDRASNPYREWEGGVSSVSIEQVIENTGSYTGSDGYFNYFA
jgi:flagellar hook-length control protein FliK